MVGKRTYFIFVAMKLFEKERFHIENGLVQTFWNKFIKIDKFDRNYKHTFFMIDLFNFIYLFSSSERLIKAINSLILIKK